MAFARRVGFRVYPETSDFDVLLVATEESARSYALIAPGEQIGVQAKLRANSEVLFQALPRTHGRRSRLLQSALCAQGPHYYAVLVPYCIPEFVAVAYQLGIYVLSAYVPERGIYIQDDSFGIDRHRELQRFEHRKMCWVPEVEVEIPAGCSAPQRLTPWKLGAVKLCLKAIEEGGLTAADFKAAGISMTRWRKLKWIRPMGWVERDAKRYRVYELDAAKRPPHLLYPEVTQALCKDR